MGPPPKASGDSIASRLGHACQDRSAPNRKSAAGQRALRQPGSMGMERRQDTVSCLPLKRVPPPAQTRAPNATGLFFDAGDVDGEASPNPWPKRRPPLPT